MNWKAGKRSKSTRNGNERQDLDLSDLLGSKVFVVRDIICSILKEEREYYYMKKNPKKTMFDILNAELLLVEDVLKMSERKSLTQSVQNNMFIISVFLACRFNEYSVYEFLNDILEYLEIYASDRIYCEKKSCELKHMRRIGVQVMAKEYKLTYKELGEMFDIDKSTVCKYINNFYNEEVKAFIDAYEYIVERTRMDVSVVRECLGNKAYMENSKNGTYTVYDLNEPERSPLRKKEVSKHEMKIIIEDFFDTINEKSVEFRN